MFKLEFKLNKYYLFVHALPLADSFSPEWESLQNELWEKFPKPYYLLTTHPEVAFTGKKSTQELSTILKQVDKMIREACESKAYEEPRPYRRGFFVVTGCMQPVPHRAYPAFVHSV